jgi:biopolymer transport protein ExbD
MALSVGRARGGAIAEINVTPMADVMIVLLIIFMVATPVIVAAPVALPAAAHPTSTRARRWTWWCEPAEA